MRAFVRAVCRSWLDGDAGTARESGEFVLAVGASEPDARVRARKRWLSLRRGSVTDAFPELVLLQCIQGRQMPNNIAPCLASYCFEPSAAACSASALERGAPSCSQESVSRVL